MERRKINISLESILVMMLLIIFAVSTSTMIIEGSNSYKNILNQKEKEENARIALSYINMRIKQNDLQSRVFVENDTVDGQSAIVLRHSGEEEGYVTYLFWKDGILWECYTDLATIPTTELSTQIVPIDAITFSQDKTSNTISINIAYSYGKEKLSIDSVVALRTQALGGI